MKTSSYRHAMSPPSAMSPLVLPMEIVMNELSDEDIETLRKIRSGKRVEDADFAWLEQCGVVTGTPLRPVINEVGKAFLD